MSERYDKNKREKKEKKEKFDKFPLASNFIWNNHQLYEHSQTQRHLNEQIIFSMNLVRQYTLHLDILTISPSLKASPMLRPLYLDLIILYCYGMSLSSQNPN